MTSTFDLWGSPHMSWRQSSYSICTPSSKFVHLPVPKILPILSHGTKQPGDIDLWPFDPGTRVERQQWHVQPLCQFWWFCNFSVLSYGKHTSNWRH